MNFVNRFVREVVLRQKCKKYGVIYRLSNGKYYNVIVSAYSDEQAISIVKHNPSTSSYHEYEPNEYYRSMVNYGKGIYVYDSIKE